MQPKFQVGNFLLWLLACFLFGRSSSNIVVTLIALAIVYGTFVWRYDLFFKSPED